MELHHAEPQEERVSAGHITQSRGESESTTGETHAHLRSTRRPRLGHEVIADCVWVDGAAAWLGGGASCGQWGIPGQTNRPGQSDTDPSVPGPLIWTELNNISGGFGLRLPKAFIFVSAGSLNEEDCNQQIGSVLYSDVWFLFLNAELLQCS